MLFTRLNVAVAVAVAIQCNEFELLVVEWCGGYVIHRSFQMLWWIVHNALFIQNLLDNIGSAISMTSFSSQLHNTCYERIGYRFLLLLHHMTWLYIRLSLNDRNDCVDLVGANRINCESSLCLQDRFMPDQRSSAYYGLSTRYQCVCRIFDALWKLNLSWLSHVSSWWSSLFIHHCCVLSNT